MGKKPQRHGWPEAKKLCRLNQNDIQMAKSLGFQPDGLIRSRPDPKQKWKLPVKYWIHELHFKRFGHVLGEEPLPIVQPADPVADEEAARLYGEQLYWEDYWERNADDLPGKHKPGKSGRGKPVVTQPAATERSRPAAPVPSAPSALPDDIELDITDKELPF